MRVHRAEQPGFFSSFVPFGLQHSFLEFRSKVGVVQNRAVGSVERLVSLARASWDVFEHHDVELHALTA